MSPSTQTFSIVPTGSLAFFSDRVHGCLLGPQYFPGYLLTVVCPHWHGTSTIVEFKDFMGAAKRQSSVEVAIIYLEDLLWPILPKHLWEPSMVQFVLQSSMHFWRYASGPSMVLITDVLQWMIVGSSPCGREGFVPAVMVVVVVEVVVVVLVEVVLVVVAATVKEQNCNGHVVGAFLSHLHNH